MSNVLYPYNPLRARGGTIVAQYLMNGRLVNRVAADRGRVRLARPRTPRRCKREEEEEETRASIGRGGVRVLHRDAAAASTDRLVREPVALFRRGA